MKARISTNGMSFGRRLIVWRELTFYALDRAWHIVLN